jgi:hypothetical protein
VNRTGRHGELLGSEPLLCTECLHGSEVIYWSRSESSFNDLEVKVSDERGDWLQVPYVGPEHASKVMVLHHNQYPVLILFLPLNP